MKSGLARAVLGGLLAAALPPASALCLRESQPHLCAKQAVFRADARPVASSSDCKRISASGQNETDRKISIRAGLVSLSVGVTDSHGRFVAGLSKDQFEVYDDKVKQQIAHFADEDVPLSLGIVFDVSGSMKERIGRALNALKRFLETLSGDDDFFVITFNDHASLLRDFTGAADQLLDRLRSVVPEGQTALYDATYMAVKRVRDGRHQKKALLIISDGQDNSNRHNYKKLHDRIAESDVQIYAIGISNYPSDYGRTILKEITQMSGGRAFFPNANDEPELFETCMRLALEMRHQYTIGFYPTDLASEVRWHKVRILVDPPKGLGRLSLCYRERYQSFER